MKKLLMLTVLVLSACSTAPNDPPVPVSNALGAKVFGVGGVAVMSGNFLAIPPGTPGDGGTADAGGGK